ncbi:MAG TPA: transcription termination factor Rho [Ktedonobacterales bacterium]
MDYEVTIAQLEALTEDELRSLARDRALPGVAALPRGELMLAVLRDEADSRGTSYAAGIFEPDPGMGFLRRHEIRTSGKDIYVSNTQVRRFGLRTGDMVSGQVRPPKDNEKHYGLLRVEAVNGMDPEAARRRPDFDNLTAIFPQRMIRLETTQDNLIGRILDLIAPVGRGQRGLIVAPPKAGKTTILKSIANSMLANYEDLHLMVALIGERPEEVTDMERAVDAEIYSSTFDEEPSAHTRVAQLVIERAKRLVESGKDVVVLLDSITRLTRAYNLAISPSGRTLSGGLDPAAINPAKKFLGAARNVEEGGSLTIIATVLVDTNSRMDDVIFEEFKGTGNMEVTLDRRMAERRIFPAIDMSRSSTRREELLLSEDVLRATVILRRMFAQMESQEGIEATQALLERMAKSKTNAEFLTALAKSMQ